MFPFVKTDGFTFCIGNPWIFPYDINKLILITCTYVYKLIYF